jgi:hypothetical protein
MIHYRALFDDLVNEPEPAATDATTANVEKEKIRDEHHH